MKLLDLLISDILDALRLCIQRNPANLNLKDFAKKKIWPTKDIDVAKSTLNQILTDQRGIKQEELIAILDAGDPEPIIAYLCQRYRFKYEPVNPEDIQKELLKGIEEIKKQLSALEKRAQGQSI